MPPDPEINQRFVRAFRAARARDGITAAFVARELDVDDATMHSYSSGRREPPRGLWPALAEMLGVPVDYFLTGENPPDGVLALEEADELAQLREDVDRQDELLAILDGDSELHGAAIAELRALVVELGDLLQPILDGEPIPVDADALLLLGRALGRRPQDGPPGQARRRGRGNKPR